MGGNMNIYRQCDGAYYYSEHKLEKADEKIENNVSAEYAFEYCGKKNFGGGACTSAKRLKPVKKYANENWRKEQRAWAQTFAQTI